jgi:hypothetical protein
MSHRDRLGDVGAAPTPPAPDRARSRAASLLRLQHAAGNRAVTHLLRQPSSTVTTGHDFPWRGEVSATWNAALRRAPAKDAEHPYANIIADLDHGTAVTVTGEERGWLHAEVVVDGKKLTGYISHELVRFTGPVDAPPASPEPPLVMNPDLFGTRWAFVTLKQAENRRLAVPDWKPTADEQQDLDRAIAWLEGTERYAVDHATFTVTFLPGGPQGKIEVQSIEDFVLFVETVEKQYPQATPGEIAGEVRQIWFGGANWEALLNSPGVSDRGKPVDIEHEPDPIARMFDIPALKSTGHKLTTDFGDVDISHVMAGIDAALNGAALEPADPDSEAHLKWQTLNAGDAGDPRDFVTWSGDIGQAYAEYLVARYVERKSARLLAFVENKASPEQLLGDIHGYIAAQVFRDTPLNVGTGWWTVGQDATVSNILRTFYMVRKAGSPGAASYESFFTEVSAKSSAEMRQLVTDRSLAFARPWYAKVAENSRGSVGSFGHDPSLSKAGILSGLMKEFEDQHAKNERDAAEIDKLGTVVDRFLPMLGGSVR